MAKNLKPCITIINIDGKEARLTYDQMREHLFNNPELWQEGKAERRKIGGKKKEAKEGPLSSVEATAKALEGKDTSEIDKIFPTYLNIEDITKIENNKTKIMRIKPQKGDVFRGVERGKLIPDYVFFVSENPRVAEQYTRAENTSGKYGRVSNKYDKDAKFQRYKLSDESKILDAKTIEGVNELRKILGKEQVDRFTPNWHKVYGLLDGISKEEAQKIKDAGYDAVKLYESDRDTGMSSVEGDSIAIINPSIIKEKPLEGKSIPEAYHAAKKDGSNPELVKAVEDLLGEKAEGKEAPVAEVEMEKYVPLTAKNIEIGKFSKDEALDYETDEKELDSGRMSEYISSMTVDVMDEDGNSIGNLIRLKDEDGIATYQATDVDGNELGKEEFDTKQEAVDAILAAHNKVKEKEFIKEQKRLAKAKEKAQAKTLSPEQKLKQAFEKWKAATGNLGIAPNWEKQAQADIELFKAAAEYLAGKIAKGAYAFEEFLKDLAKVNVENVQQDRDRWKKFYDDEVSKQKPKAEKKPEQKPVAEEEPEQKEPTKEKEVPKKVVGRRYAADTEKMQQALEEIGLFRTPGSIQEAERRSAQLVKEVGIDAALDVARNERLDGLYKTGIYAAVLLELDQQKENTNDVDEFAALTLKEAQITDELSAISTFSGQQLKMLQNMYENMALPFDYTSRKKEFISQFGEENFTKEVEKRFEELSEKYKKALADIDAMEKEKEAWQRQSLIDSLASEQKEEPQKKKSFFKEAAQRVRKLVLSKPGFFSNATPASLAWDASVEAVALALDGLGTLEVAIRNGIEKLRSTEWYKNLSNSKQNEAEELFTKEIENAYIPKAIINDDGKVELPEGSLKAYVDAGYKDAEKIVDKIYEQLSPENPNITKRDIRDAISGYGKQYNPTRNQVREQMNDIKNVLKLISAIEDVQNGIEKTTNPKRKTVLSDRRRDLLLQYEAAYQAVFGRKPSQPSDATRYGIVKNNLQKAIDRLRQLKPRPERRPPIEYDDELESLAAEKFRLQEEWDSEFAKAEFKNKAWYNHAIEGIYALTQLPKSLLVGGYDLGQILIQGSIIQFANAAITKQAYKNLATALWSEKEYQKHVAAIRGSEMYRIMKKSGLDIVTPVRGQLRVEETGVDTLAETIFDLLISPLKLVSPKAYDLARRLNFIRATNRAQSSFTNTLKVANFLAQAELLKQKGITFYNNPKAYKDIAAEINLVAFRSKLGGLEQSKLAIMALNTAFFAPRNIASGLRMFVPLIAIPDIARRRAGADPYRLSVAQSWRIKTFAKFVVSTSAAIMASAALAGGDEDEEEKKKEGNVSVDLKNINSSAFAKYRIGNQIFDPWGGKMQIITLQARLLLNALGMYAYKDPYTGVEKNLEDTYFKSAGGLMAEFTKGKFAPAARIGWQLAFSNPVKGKPGYRKPVDGGPEFHIGDPIQESYENITIKAIMDTYKNQPLGIQELAALMIIAGGGITTLNNKEELDMVGQIKDIVNPEAVEVKKFKKAFSNYLSNGDSNKAEEIFDVAVGQGELREEIKAAKAQGKSTSELEDDLARERRKAAKKLFNGLTRDDVKGKYLFEEGELRKNIKGEVVIREDVLDAIINNKNIDVSDLSEKRKERIERINKLSKEQREEIARDYKLQYEELMESAKGLDKMLKTEDDYYQNKAMREPWVRVYLEVTQKK
jgi:hypothetical protein